MTSLLLYYVHILLSSFSSLSNLGSVNISTSKSKHFLYKDLRNFIKLSQL